MKLFVKDPDTVRAGDWCEPFDGRQGPGVFYGSEFLATGSRTGAGSASPIVLAGIVVTAMGLLWDGSRTSPTQGAALAEVRASPPDR